MFDLVLNKPQLCLNCGCCKYYFAWKYFYSDVVVFFIKIISELVLSQGNERK